jgi:hypothetical protein
MNNIKIRNTTRRFILLRQHYHDIIKLSILDFIDDITNL